MASFKDIKNACGLIEDTASGAMRGTGYLIDADLVATCWHVVEGCDPRGLSIDFRGTRLDATVRAHDTLSDCALLALTQPPPAEVKPLPIGGECYRKAPWDGYGYPGAAKRAGLALDGAVDDPEAEDDLKAPVLELFSPNIAAGMATRLHGFSGSPVVVDGLVVGHLKRFVADPEHPTRPAYGKVYATRSECILGLRAGMRSDNAPPPPPLSPPRPGTPLAEEGAQKIQKLLAGWRKNPDAPREKAGWIAAESLIQLGAPDQALGVLTTLPGSLRADQLQALALAKTGVSANLDKSTQILLALREQGHVDAETFGLLGGRLKQRWLDTGDPRDLEQSFDFYLDAFKRTDDYYPGINAAALALWLKRPDKDDLAYQALSALEKTPPAHAQTWHSASMGEAYLLTGDLGRAKLWYGEAAKNCDYAAETVQTMQRQARRNLKELGLDEAALDDCFKRG